MKIDDRNCYIDELCVVCLSEADHRGSCCQLDDPSIHPLVSTRLQPRFFLSCTRLASLADSRRSIDVGGRSLGNHVISFALIFIQV